MKNLFRLNEKDLIRWMISFYCKENHHSTKNICFDCEDLLKYAQERIEKCPHGENKPVCSQCEIHCYRKDKREKIKEVMRFSGPAVMRYKPLAGISYMLKKYKFRR